MLQIPKYQGGVHLVIKKIKILGVFLLFTIVPIKKFFHLFLFFYDFRFKIQMFSFPGFIFLFFVTR